jgi:hypothetical protein
MFCTSRFYYSPEDLGAGGNPSDGGETSTVTKPAAAVELPADIKTELEQLRAFKQAATTREPEKTPDQIQRENELERVNFRKFAVEEKLMKDEDFSGYESVTKKADADLVYDKFAAEQKEDDPTLTPEQIRENFDNEYKLNSDNEKAKVRGEQKIAREAKELRNPFTSKYTEAENSYKERKSLTAQLPKFEAFIDEVIKENTPEKLVLFKAKEGEEEVPIETELSEDQRKEISKLFKNPKNFRDYADSGDKKDDLKTKIAKKITGYLKINNFEKVAEKSFETGKGIGLKKGSTVGSTNPFALIRDINTPTREQKVSAQQAVNDNQTELRDKVRTYL